MPDPGYAYPMSPTSPDADKVISYFVASFVPEEAARVLVSWGERLPADVVRNPATRMHVTYRSFDGMPPGRYAPLRQALRRVAARHPPFTVRIRGGGVFAAGAVWVRMISAEILALQADIDREMALVGCPGASHPFVPHLTLGHGPPGIESPPWLSDVALEFDFDELLLTTTGHKEYRVAVRFPLGVETEDDEA